MRHPIHRIAIPLVKFAVLALVIWGGHRTIAAGLSDLGQRGWTLGQLRPTWVVVAAALYLISQLPSGWFWYSILSRMNQPVGLLQALRAYYIGHLGKYVPGKAMVVILRAAFVGQPGVRTTMAVVAVFYETFTTMAVGAFVAALVLVVTRREQTWLIAGSFALALVVGLPTLPPVFVRVLRFMRLVKDDSEVNAPSIQLRFGLLVGGWLAIGIGWVFAGASLWATLRAIGVDNTNLLFDLPLCTATVALAVVLGFVSLLPAGVGVRDVALLELLAPRLEQLVPHQGQLLALVAVIVLRLIWLGAELALAALLYPLRRKHSGQS